MGDAGAGKNLIFILGIMPRSGTNYLNNLLLLHPDCEYPGFVWEDYLVAPAENLHLYVQSVNDNWHPSWKHEVEKHMGNNSLMGCIGEGLNMFMNRQYKSSLESGLRESGKEWKGSDNYPKLVTATPSVNNINHFFELFPSATLLIVIRDGRSVVESGIKSFNWDFEQAVRRWTNAADRILKLEKSNVSGRYMIVKYEDLFADMEKEVKKIFAFIGLDIGAYNFKAAGDLGVTGSSELQDMEGHIHWKARKKTKDFDPLERWSHWGLAQHERFNWLAGKNLERIGYQKRPNHKTGVFWKSWNLILDGFYELEIWTSRKALLLSKPVSQLRKLLFSLPDRFNEKNSRP